MASLSAQTLAGKVAIVTGSSRGLGAVMALDLAKRGANITTTYISASSSPKAEALRGEIASLSHGSSAIAVQGNFKDLDVPACIIAETLARFGPHIDILINNATTELAKPMRDIGGDELTDVFHLNVRAVHLLTQAVIRHLRAPGRIVNISSVSARAGFANLSAYCTSRAALENLTRVSSAEFGKTGTTEIVDMQKANTPVQRRIGTAQEVADVVGWLASGESAWVSRQTINVSGGSTMY